MIHYFGEEFDPINGLGAKMDDNTKNPKKQTEAQDSVEKLLTVVKGSKEKYKSKDIVATLRGKSNAMLLSHKTNERDFFGIGKDKDLEYWKALIRQTLVTGYLRKEIEQYGVLKVTEKGQEYLKKPVSFMMTEDHIYVDEDDRAVIIANAKNKAVVSTDQELMGLLKSLRKSVGKKKGIPPYAIFQDPSLEDMTLKYPTNIEELSNIHGVGDGKAKKFGKEFVALIAKYVKDNDIEKLDDFVVKTTGEKSGLKLYIIQNTDRKLPLEDLAKAKGLEMDELIKEIESIVYSGTKLNIDYYLEDILDEDQQEEIHDYFMEAENDSIEEALEEFDGDYDNEELRLMRIKFISDVAN